mmetsp:Transcript_37238/g.86855  ORF Transcript_37238/g.86855 Transcript_37238/m.86855 type:complete len:140 (-) Transcript_37238:127-546(-)
MSSARDLAFRRTFSGVRDPAGVCFRRSDRALEAERRRAVSVVDVMLARIWFRTVQRSLGKEKGLTFDSFRTPASKVFIFVRKQRINSSRTLGSEGSRNFKKDGLTKQIIARKLSKWPSKRKTTRNNVNSFVLFFVVHNN